MSHSNTIIVILASVFPAVDFCPLSTQMNLFSFGGWNKAESEATLGQMPFEIRQFLDYKNGFPNVCWLKLGK